ncbi:hypothetical protein [Nocardiopsis tropica]|uniref:Uncharacterized protein n=1 Tax=Nocardiopsis tropica TaxID=109330 RepID=A0ABU7KST4_9ACTN|nr:hypothetical protein [Nocardiopsis umidischolae]MEE2051702.1 hypothetical protein [Nocardiopsis umidischolae]
MSVADLPDNKAAQVSEAMKESVPFVMNSGKVFIFRPLAEWSYNANKAFTVGDIEAWARGALATPSELGNFLDSPSLEVGRIIRYYDEMAGATRGEDSSSSPS